MSQPPLKRRRVEITAAQKKQICQYKQRHPRSNNAEILTWAKEELGITIGKSTVGDILRASDTWLHKSESNSSTRARLGQHPNLEAAVVLWLNDVRSRNAVVNDEMMLEKARKFGAELHIENFNYSRGWLSRLKERHGISSHKLHGESASADIAIVDNGRKCLQEVLRPYDGQDIFNMDETALFYNLGPTTTLSTAGKAAGCKTSKARVTVALCCNSTGTEKLKPLVIARACRPRCFGKTFDPNIYVTYKHNSKAWMTSEIFREWLSALDKQMKRKGRQILLLLDNASCHSAGGLQTPHVKIHFLPPNTTSHIQPLDAGVIHSFKSHYRKQLVRHYIHCAENDMPQIIDVRKALSMINHAWSQVTSTTISRCWNHVGILPQALSEWDSEEDDLPLATLRDLMLSLTPEVTEPEVYVSIDNNEPTTGEMTDSNIIDIVTGTLPEAANSEDSQDAIASVITEVPVVISSTKALSHMNELITYLEVSGLSKVSSHILNIQNLISEVEVRKQKVSRQVSLTSFFLPLVAKSLTKD